jgi:hypothetical protein
MYSSPIDEPLRAWFILKSRMLILDSFQSRDRGLTKTTLRCRPRLNNARWTPSIGGPSGDNLVRLVDGLIARAAFRKVGD